MQMLQPSSHQPLFHFIAASFMRVPLWLACLPLCLFHSLTGLDRHNLSIHKRVGSSHILMHLLAIGILPQE